MTNSDCEAQAGAVNVKAAGQIVLKMGSDEFGRRYVYRMHQTGLGNAEIAIFLPLSRARMTDRPGLADATALGDASVSRGIEKSGCS